MTETHNMQDTLTTKVFAWRYRRSMTYWAGRGVVHIILVLGALVFSLPFLWLITTSFKSPEEIFEIPIQWVPKVFKQTPLEWDAVFANFKGAAAFVPINIWIGNTLYVALLNVIFHVLSGSLVAFGFSRIQWRGRDVVFVLVLATMMLPHQVTMIPTFLIYKKLGWYNTLKPLWFGSVFGTAFQIFLLRQFMLQLPRDIDDAARIDGCSYFRIWRTITLPLIKPALAVVAVETFQGAWNNFMGPYLYINTQDKMTVALGLQWFQGEYGGMYGEMMAMTLLLTLPIIVVFFICQRYMIQGITLSGMKL